jgi:hypothetical protein
MPPSQVVQASDVIIEVLDARDPLGTRCVDVERFARRVDPSKKIVLLLNKIGEGGWRGFLWVGGEGAGRQRGGGRSGGVERWRKFVLLRTFGECAWGGVGVQECESGEWME